jgi:hypothetical protein
MQELDLEALVNCYQIGNETLSYTAKVHPLQLLLPSWIQTFRPRHLRPPNLSTAAFRAPSHALAFLQNGEARNGSARLCLKPTDAR